MSVQNDSFSPSTKKKKKKKKKMMMMMKMTMKTKSGVVSLLPFLLSVLQCVFFFLNFFIFVDRKGAG